MYPYHSEEAAPTIPPELQAAIDGGKEDEVKELIAKLPDTFSKSLKKKLQKDAQIAAKKIAKGGAPPAAKPVPPSAPAAAGKTAAAPQGKVAAKPAAAAAAQPTGASTNEGVVGAAQATLVADLIACAETLGIDVAKLRENEATLALALTPTVNALRNEAYTLGFMCEK